MELVIGIIGILLTLWTIKIQFYSKPKGELEHMILTFKSTQKLSLQVQDELETLIVQYNSWECEMFPNLTYRTCLEEMKACFKTNLTDDVLKNILSYKLSKSTILSLTQSLETRQNSLIQLQANLNLVRRQMANNEIAGT